MLDKYSAVLLPGKPRRWWSSRTVGERLPLDEEAVCKQAQDPSAEAEPPHAGKALYVNCLRGMKVHEL